VREIDVESCHEELEQESFSCALCRTAEQEYSNSAAIKHVACAACAACAAKNHVPRTAQRVLCHAAGTCTCGSVCPSDMDWADIMGSNAEPAEIIQDPEIPSEKNKVYVYFRPASS